MNLSLTAARLSPKETHRIFLKNEAPSRRSASLGLGLGLGPPKYRRRVSALELQVHLRLYSAIAMRASQWQVKHNRRRAKIRRGPVRGRVRVCVYSMLRKFRAKSGQSPVIVLYDKPNGIRTRTSLFCPWISA